jgi:hypothetical protein
VQLQIADRGERNDAGNILPLSGDAQGDAGAGGMSYDNACWFHA